MKYIFEITESTKWIKISFGACDIEKGNTGVKHKISLEKIENIILKSKEKSILEKFTAGVDSYKILCDYIAENQKRVSLFL